VNHAQLALFGGFQLTCAGARVAIPASAQRVLAFLALSGRALPRAHVAGTLWSGASEARAAAALRTAVWRIGPPALEVLRCDASMLGLRVGVDVDVDRVASDARTVLEGAVDGLAPDRIAAIRDPRDLLPGWYDDWVVIERERLRQLRVHALERLCLWLSDEGRHVDAVQAGLAAIACDPLRESAHRALVVAHLAYGNVGDALKQYVLCRGLLERGLGVQPSPDLERLVATVRRGR
jgi:DNA-binding SARP family transcriptional activator